MRRALLDFANFLYLLLINVVYHTFYAFLCMQYEAMVVLRARIEW